MPTQFRAAPHGRKVVFKASNTARSRSHPTKTQAPSASLDKNSALGEEKAQAVTNQRRHHLAARDERMSARQYTIPDLFTTLPPVQDGLDTDTSRAQKETVQECLPFVAATHEFGRGELVYNAYGIPSLHRERHIDYFFRTLDQYPGGFVAYDASRPWIIYWALTGLALLGENVSPLRLRVIQTLSPAQNPDGGFGGGQGQMSHCAPSYAAILSLAMVGGLDIIDRNSLWRWLGSVKQEDGSFAVTQGGEIDVRGAYCAMVMIALLDLPLELPHDAPARAAGLASFVDRLPQWLSNCQTYEGGISACPGTEAHGAYAFCALACLCILDEPDVVLPKYLDLPLLVSWISARQYAPEGGFAGRTNKLVDACYSHWVGGCWPFLEAALHAVSASVTEMPDVGSLYNREGLIRYIMACSQRAKGGFRDKPSKGVDGYHSCYALAGLSVAQHGSAFGTAKESHPNGLESPFRWTRPEPAEYSSTALSRFEGEILDREDYVKVVHPVFAIPFEAVEDAQKWCRRHRGFT